MATHLLHDLHGRGQRRNLATHRRPGPFDHGLLRRPRPTPYPTAPPEALLVGIEQGKEDVFLNGAGAIAGRNDFPHQNGTGNPPPAILGVLAARHFARVATQVTEIPTPVGPLALAALGSRISVRGTEFEVQGIIEPETNQLLRSAVLVPLEDAQCVLQSPDSVTALLVSPKRASDIDPLQETIESEHEELMVISDKQLIENAHKLLDRVNQLFDVVRWTSVTVAALLIAIVMFVSVLERTRELGTLRAIGAPRRALLSLILSESAGFAAAGSLVGIPMSRVVISKRSDPTPPASARENRMGRRRNPQPLLDGRRAHARLASSPGRPDHRPPLRVTPTRPPS